MPRIDPVQLLNCLNVLLSRNGGIKSTDEVQRLASLMTKFSKKLVSKCIYIQILKFTETELLGLFMGSGGWRLVHTWLTESIVAKNWPLVRELLELLLLCPVDIERLKTNNCPKLVKELSKDGNHIAIRALASKLVEQWLKTVKGDQVTPIQLSEIPQIIADEIKSEVKPDIKSEIYSEHTENCDKLVKLEIKSEVEAPIKSEFVENDASSENKEEKVTESVPVLKINVKDGIVLSKVEEQDNKSEDVSDKDKSKDKHKSKSKEKSEKDKNSKSSSSRHSSKSHSSSSDKDKSHKSSSSSRHSSSSSSKDKDKSKDKDRHSSHSSSRSKNDSHRKSSVSSSSKTSCKTKNDKEDDKNKTISDKDKKDKSKEETRTEKSEDKQSKPEGKEKTTPSIQKLGKIPKLSEVKKEKPSMSIEDRRRDIPKPTIKTFQSKFRKHGLEEEVKPPPSRAALLNKKVPPVLPPTIPVPKRPSPVPNEAPPEKKPKTIEIKEKPGSIKLIPPKPKPMLQESLLFMDALNASATNKKEPKKRKRRTSGSKDGNAPNEGSPPHTPTSTSSPGAENKSVPPRFYQDTLETEERKEKSSNQEDDAENSSEKEDSMDTSEPHTLTVNGLKGVLCYHKKKGPKKTIKWKPDSELEEIQYFELDETERVNVTKTFTDMKHLERINEREAFQKARNLANDDVMEEKTNWKPLILIDCEGQIHVEYGKNSKEKEIQAIRQKGTLQPLYFHKSMIPDSPLEPDPETHPYTEPTIIPLEDVTGNQDNVSDFRNMPWPEPKGNAPPPGSGVNMANMFPTNIPQFPAGFPPAQFPGIPAFQGPPNMVPTEWQNGVTPPMMPNGMPIPPGALAPGALPPPGMMPGITPEGMMMNPEMFGAPNPMFPVPPDAFSMPQNMFPMDFNMPGPQGPGPDGFGPGNFRGAMRGRGNGGHWRGKNSGNWDGPPRGRGGHSRGGRKAVCMYFQRKGSCRQGDNCSFLHPGVNCPY